MSATLGEGCPHPLGVTPVADGVNVAIYSAHATAIELCLFDAQDREVRRVRLPERTGDVFHGFIGGVRSGDRYGLRAYGPFDPANGHRFNPAKLLLDPHARLLDRPFRLHRAMFGYRPEEGDLSLDTTDSAAVMPKALVTLPPGARVDHAPLVPWRDTVIYEAHVRGFTQRHPEVREVDRGTFAGLADPAAVAHLVKLGVTTVEILPCAAWIDERHLTALGLSNYWGYNPVAWMAPEPRLAPGGWADIRRAVETLAEAGIETIVDVVLNHSGEGDELGPTLSLRGLDNATYYRLRADDPRRYVDDAGTGNSLALDRAPVVRLAMDGLRTWVRQAGVHGFRFDLATTLARRADGFDPQAPLLAAIQQDPELAPLKLIAEPWDIGPGGYQLGRFPAGWGEWNDRYRDDVRRFWRGEAYALGAAATRLAGSADLFAAHRPVSRSINFVTAHDGFTLADLVAHAGKHNYANGEDNRDGSNENFSWNNGVEGPSDDPAILEARQRDQRALLATLLLSRGTPMLAMGAELGQTQHGNNNAYAQDNALSWLDWAGADRDLLAFAKTAIAARRSVPLLRRITRLTGEVDGDGAPDVAWLSPAGVPMTETEWHAPDASALLMLLADKDSRVGVILHRGAEPCFFQLPEPRAGQAWEQLLDSASGAGQAAIPGRRLQVAARSVMLIREYSLASSADS